MQECRPEYIAAVLGSIRALRPFCRHRTKSTLPVLLPSLPPSMSKHMRSIYLIRGRSFRQRRSIFKIFFGGKFCTIARGVPVFEYSTELHLCSSCSRLFVHQIIRILHPQDREVKRAAAHSGVRWVGYCRKALVERRSRSQPARVAAQATKTFHEQDEQGALTSLVSVIST